MKPKQEDSAELERKQTIRKDAILSVIIDAFSSLLRSNPAQAAASISYYTLISLFPMVLFMIVILSYFLELTVIQQELVDFLSKVLPGAEKLVVENLQNIFTRRTATSITATLTLLWSGSGAFNSVIANIHRAWPESRGRGYFVNRFFAMGGILLIFLVMAGLMTASVVVNISTTVPVFEIDVSKVLQVLFTLLFNYILPILLMYCASYLLYCYVPSVPVDRQAAKIGAWTTSIAWRVFTFIFSLFIFSPFNTYDLIYGSLTVIIIMLIYVFFCSYIVLFCAHLVAAITHYKLKKGIISSNETDEIAAQSEEAVAVKKSRRSVKQTISYRWQRFVKKLRMDLIKIAESKPAIRKKMHQLRSDERWPEIKKTIEDFFSSLFRWK